MLQEMTQDSRSSDKVMNTNMWKQWAPLFAHYYNLIRIYNKVVETSFIYISEVNSMTVLSLYYAKGVIEVGSCRSISGNQVSPVFRTNYVASERAEPLSKLKTSSTFLRMSVPVADHTTSKVTNKKGNAAQDVTLELTNPYSLANRTLRFGQFR
uniref:Uncharacterized protein n=1 Tax=Vespula pensylvanica TaxID=30213 RepID=A0A834PFE4_VESPE|nr:hypothetical protein H0235_001063 [Vespula pensylvanica]